MNINKIIEKIYGTSFREYLLTYPLFLIVGLSVLLIFISLPLVLLIGLSYTLWFVLLKVLFFRYILTLVKYRYINATIYDIDHLKCLMGWIDIDVSETYLIKIVEKEVLDAMINKINDEIKFLENELTKFKINSKSYNKIKKSIKNLKEELLSPEYNFEYLDYFRKVLEIFDIKDWEVYYSKIAYSDIYLNSSYIIFILPNNFDITFNFTDDLGNFRGNWVKVPNFASATFIEIEKLEYTPILLDVFSSVHSKYYFDKKYDLKNINPMISKFSVHKKLSLGNLSEINDKNNQKINIERGK